MEIGQAEITEVNKNTGDQEKSIELMKKLFPKNAQIENIGGRDDKEYKIKAILEDSPFCEGGQEIELKVFLLGLSSLEEIRLEEGWIIDPHVKLKVLSFLVNGEEINDEKDNVIINGFRGLNNENPEYKLKSVNSFIKHNDCNIVSIDNAAGAAVSIREIFINKMSTGSNLAIFLHEKGHLLREVEDIDTDELTESILDFADVIEKIGNNDDINDIEQEITPENAELFRKIIYEERRACIKSLYYIQQHKNLFPNDPDLLKLKNYYVNNMSTYFRFQRGIRRDEVVTIMDFDQDWHY